MECGGQHCPPEVMPCRNVHLRSSLAAQGQLQDAEEAAAGAGVVAGVDRCCKGPACQDWSCRRAGRIRAAAAAAAISAVANGSVCLCLVARGFRAAASGSGAMSRHRTSQQCTLRRGQAALEHSLAERSPRSFGLESAGLRPSPCSTCEHHGSDDATRTCF